MSVGLDYVLYTNWNMRPKIDTLFGPEKDCEVPRFTLCRFDDQGDYVTRQEGCLEYHTMLVDHINLQVLATMSSMSLIVNAECAEQELERCQLFLGLSQKVGFQPRVYQYRDGILEKRPCFDYQHTVKVQKYLTQLDVQAKAFTASLDHVVVDVDYGSTALWIDGVNYPYENFDLPFSMIRRLERWADSYWNFLYYSKQLEPQWKAFENEQKNLVEALQALWPHIVVS